MKRRTKAAVLVLAAALQMTVVALVTAGPASAAVGPADDRQKTTPTSWWTYTGKTAAQVENLRIANGARLTDIQVDNASTPTFTVVMVKNASPYATNWWWYYGKTQNQVSALITTNQARLISAQAYNTSAGIRFAVVMVKNTGANSESWWWYHGSTTYLTNQWQAHHARMINVTPYPGGGYLGIMVDNTGTNAVSGGWWWYVGASYTTIDDLRVRNGARIIDLSRNGDGTYNAVMYHNTSTRWYWYVGQSPSGAVTKAVQLGERIIDATSYYVGGVKKYAVVMTNNLSGLNNKLWNIIGPKVDSGAYGFYLKQVGGSTLGGLEQTLQYEPASALKVLYHAKSIHAEALGNAHDNDTVTYHYDPLDVTNGDICPDGYASTATTNLKNADTLMMQNSDNRMTRGILEKYGKTAMLNYASALGLTSTEIHHNIGCGTPHNKTTLVDLGKVYEGFQNGTVTSNSTWRTQFRSRMLNQNNYEPNYHDSICPIVSQEATALGKSAATATSFCNAMTWIAKGGSYQYADNFPYTVSWDGLSMTGLPYMSSGTVAPRYFVFGEFVDGTSIDSQTERDSVNAARAKLYQEALRPYIRAALATW